MGAAARGALLLFLVGATCNNQVVEVAVDAHLAEGVAPAVSVRAIGQAGPVGPGGLEQRAAFVQCPKPGGPDTVAMLWYPPAGATSPVFLDVQPANPQGPPPYQFASVAVTDVADAQAGPSLTVAYAAPAPPQPSGALSVVDVFVAVAADGGRHAAAFKDAEDAGGAALVASAAGASLLAAAPASAAAASAADPYSWWATEQTLTSASSAPIDETLCQQWAGLLQGGAFFIALRYPVLTPDAFDARSAVLPVAQPAGGATPRLELHAAPPAPATVLGVPLELRPDRLAFAESVLPQADGERWVTLAPAAQPPADCPGDLAGAWSLVGDVALDFGGAAAACTECVVQEYLCYEGTDAPFFLASGATLGAQSVIQTSGTTCVGPFALRLAGEQPSPPFTLAGASLARTGSGALVKLAHHLRAWLAPDVETQVDLGTSSARGVPWKLYSDSALKNRISGPVTISGAAEFDFWAAVQLPFGFRGAESVVVTASSVEQPTQGAWTSDHLWAGSWTAPPPVPELHLVAAQVAWRHGIEVAGTLPDGSYRLAVVPNGSYLPGTCYAGAVLGAATVTVTGATLPPTFVGAATVPGGFDVLALSGVCDGGSDDARIVTGDDLAAGAGVTVTREVHRRLSH